MTVSGISSSKAIDSGDLKAAREGHAIIQNKIAQGRQTAQGAQQSGKPAGGEGQGASGSVSSSLSSNKTYDKMDANEDGVVTATEEYAYRLKHPKEAAKAATEKTTNTTDLLQESNASSIGTIIDTIV